MADKIRQSLHIKGVAEEFVEKFNQNILQKTLDYTVKKGIKKADKLYEIDKNENKFVIRGRDRFLRRKLIADNDDAKLIHYYAYLHSESNAHHRTAAFLSWHRLYLKEFEDDLDMPLPYWDWYNHPELPMSLKQASLIANSDAESSSYFMKLIRARETFPKNGVIKGNKGAKKESFNKLWKYVGDQLKGTSFNWHTDFAVILEGRSNNAAGIKYRFHDEGHVAIGGNGHLGRIPTAVFDPVFWLHHAFIDKLWVDFYEVFEAAGFGDKFYKNGFPSGKFEDQGSDASILMPYRDANFEDTKTPDGYRYDLPLLDAFRLLFRLANKKDIHP